MGFQRTSDGRVFFQGADNEAANDKPAGRSQTRRSTRRGPAAYDDIYDEHDSARKMPHGRRAPLSERMSDDNAGPAQGQIIALLKSLNQKLHASQVERKQLQETMSTYRSLISELERKAARSQQAYELLEEKLATRDRADVNKIRQAEDMAKEAMQELQDTRSLLLDLENKADRADRGVSTLKNQIVETQKTNLTLSQKHKKSEQSYEELLARLKKTEEHQEDLSEKVENAVAQQTQLMRKLDKAIEDRSRFMRKMERIEEAVLQTQDSLNSKAMVLLTEQGVAGQRQMNEAHGAQPESEPKPVKALTAAPWWQRTSTHKTAAIAALIAFGLITGWAINQIQDTGHSAGISYNESYWAAAPAQNQNTPATRPVTAAPALEQTAETMPPATQDPVDGQIDGQDQNAQPETTSTAELIEMHTQDDIGMVHLADEEKLVALLDDNPDALAEILNRIEPGSTAEEAKAPEVESLEAEAPIEIASLPQEAQFETPEPAPAPTPAQEPVANESAPVSTPATTERSVEPANITAPSSDLGALIKRDSNLPDVIKAIEDQAFEGIAEAQHDLAAIYTAGHGGVDQDYKRAAFWFEQAGANGIANARYNLGVLYHQGLGVRRDLDEALNWYKGAAELSHPEAQYNLGIAYIEGIGVPYDPVIATRYFENAANAGIMEAAYNLGLIYENGLLGRTQPEEALMWYKIAADAGSPEAKAALAQLAETLGISMDEIKAVATGERNASPVTTQETSAAPASSIYASAEQGVEQVLVAQIQDYLTVLGLYPGPSDGVNGPLTSDAIRSYQSLHGLRENGRPSDTLLTHMVNMMGPMGENGQGSRE